MADKDKESNSFEGPRSRARTSTSDSEGISNEPQEPSKILGLLGRLFGKEEAGP